MASQDDAIHALLLLGTGSSAPSYEQRLAMAAKLGYVPKTYARPAHQAVTMGEVSTMAVKLLEGRRLDQAGALEKLAQRGIAPASLKTMQGLTGAQLVSIAGGIRDAMTVEGVRRVAAPNVEISRPSRAPAVTVAETTEPMPGEAMGSASGVALGEATRGVNPSMRPVANDNTMPGTEAANLAPSKGRVESLPNIPYGTVPPAIDLSDPKGKPVVIGPDDQVITPGQPRSKASKPTPAPNTPVAAEMPPVNSTPAGGQPAANPTPATAGTTPANEAAPVVRKTPKWVVGKPLRQKTATAEENK